MPIGAYYSGSGKKVMKSMKKQYGEKKGEEVFYAVANKGKGMKPKKGKKQKGKNPFFGNTLPFQLGSGGKWFPGTRKTGKAFCGD